MVSIDLKVENINRYKLRMLSKKLYWAIFTFLVNAAISNAWDLIKFKG